MKKENNNNQIDIIIPAYKAHGTIYRTLSSILMQTIKDDCNVIIVNDACPEGSYKVIAGYFCDLGLNVQEIKLEKNMGPGVARQKGIEAGNSKFFTCIDADDTFSSAIALETMRIAILENEVIKCVSATFMQLGENLQQIVPHQNDMVWMFGKMYRRDFINKYNIKFNKTRANEDTGFNMIVKLLCDNPNEQIRFISDVVYLWHNKTNSITRINDGQYAYDQCFCGWTDNMIYAIKCAKKCKPFSGSIIQQIVGVMINLYFYWIEIYEKQPLVREQNWEYVKKFYHSCYKKIEEDIPDNAFAEMFSIASTQKYSSGSMIGIIPYIGIKEFLDKVRNDKYDENDIYDIWDKMKKDPEAQKLIENNEECGVCAKGYTNRPFDFKEIS